MSSKENVETLTKEQKAALKAQRKAEFDAKFQKDKAVDEGKSKAELKAERRAKQEAQRAAKNTNGAQSTKAGNNQQQPAPPAKIQSGLGPKAATPGAQSPPDIAVAATESKSPLKETTSPESGAKNGQSVLPEAIISHKELPNKIFAHLPRRILDLSEVSTFSIPSVVVQVGYRINKEMIKGSTAKCIAMLMAFKSVVEAHQLTDNKDMKRNLQKILFTDCLKFLNKCRPLSMSMSNAVKYLKMVFTRLPNESEDKHVQEIICDSIDSFIEEEILLSWKAIVDFSLHKILDDDVILTLGCSTIVKHVLYNAAENSKKKFKVIVVDTRPKFEGKEMLQFLVKNNIPATYVLINSISYVMKQVTKVIIEAHSLLANGYVMSHIGSSQVALVAKAYNVPVIVCCETYKFSDRVHTDCFVHNELGGDNRIFFDSLRKNQIENSESPNLNVLDLLYDLTPHEFVSAVITEKGSLPCTSAPAILRARETK